MRRNTELIKANFIKIEHYKISKLFGNLTVSKFVTKLKQMIYQVDNIIPAKI